MKVSPNNGGCWFCHEVDDRPMLFSCEFDCFLHDTCLMSALAASSPEAEDWEAEITAREFNIPRP